jgi:polar amino acid transport system substrate-binding protein
MELPVLDGGGNVTGLQGVAQDISERKKAQETHVMSAQVEAMQKLIRGLSHEIRNPLFGISSVSQVLQREMEDEKYLPMVKALNTESNRIANLIEELNMYAAPKNPVISHIDASSFIDKLLLKFSEKYPNVNFKVNIEPSITIKGDESLLAYAVEQLFENSCQAGAAEINIDIYPDIFLYDEQVNFSVRDNGKGINEKEMLKCFEPFYTTKQGSTGLGLSLSKRIIEIHGGRFNISSGAGEGTSISFSI